VNTGAFRFLGEAFYTPIFFLATALKDDMSALLGLLPFYCHFYPPVKIIISYLGCSDPLNHIIHNFFFENTT
jgi:hypothetical protein